MFVFRLPDQLQRVASALDDAFPREAVYVHVDSRATEAGVEGFASNGRVWIASGAFRPHTMAGLQLIGHELAHLAQQKRAGTSGLGALEVVDDPALEAAADCFGAAFADSSLFGARWLQACDVAAPSGPVQCAGKTTDRQRDAILYGIHEEDDVGNYLGGGLLRNNVNNTLRIESGLQTGYALSSLAVTAVNNVGYVLPAVGSAVAPIVSITGPLSYVLTAAEMALAQRSYLSTIAHIEQLELILLRGKGTAARTKVFGTTFEAIEFAITKKRAKLKVKNKARFGVGFINTILSVPRGIKKRADGTLGLDRSMHAASLWWNMSRGDPVAVDACRELLGEPLFSKARRHADGDKLLKKCMQSK